MKLVRFTLFYNIFANFLHHRKALIKLSGLCVSFFWFIFGKLEKNQKNRFLMYYKSQRNDIVSFQYLKKSKGFLSILKLFIVKSNMLNPKMNLFFKSEYFSLT